MTPRLAGSVDEIRARVPRVRDAHAEIGDNVLRSGAVDPALKELCFRRLAGDARIAERDPLSDRARAALDWTDAIAHDSALADDALWSRLHAHFTEPELVELGCAIGFELGFQHWRRSLGFAARE